MRIANLAGRVVVVTGAPGAELAHDVDKASGGRFGPDPQSLFDNWDAFTAWASTASLVDGARLDVDDLGPPVPRPRQVFAIGLNYRAHAAESGFAVPSQYPPIFTKWPSCLNGPHSDIVLPAGGDVDWELELVAVIGRRARNVDAADAAAYIAGYTVGQDISERRLQMASTPPQFGLAKSLPGFGPTGPWLVSADELADAGDLGLRGEVNGEVVQSGRTSAMIFGVTTLVEQLSHTLPLLPGDLIFTGTPDGVGMGRTPPRYLAAGDVLTSHIDGIGEMRHRFVHPTAADV